MKFLGACGTLLACALAVSSAQANGERIGWQTSYAQAYEQAVKTQRPLVIKFTAPGCAQCEKLQTETMVDETVVKLIEERYVALELDTERNAELIEKFRVQSFPATLVVNPDLQIVKRIEGFQSASAMAYELTSSLPENRKAPTSFPSYNYQGST